MFELNKKTLVITGAGSGIGRAMALLFAKQGAQVNILDKDAEGAARTTEMINNDHGAARFFPCDVSDQSEVRKRMADITAVNPVIDILINNAGIAHIGNAENTQEADFDRVMTVNVKGIYNCIHCVLPYMRPQGGVILNMASVAATIGIPDRFAYSTSKGAIVAMTLSVAKDYIKDKIRCNCISPARVHTPFIDGYLARDYPGKEKEMFEKLAATQPIGRMARPEEIAQLALYLCSDEAAFITGCDYPIDGGFTRLNN
jgi:NAD(P)-dependent dehydrogenase (short-subunit alcohol dehydrogenase family)